MTRKPFFNTTRHPESHFVRRGISYINDKRSLALLGMTLWGLLFSLSLQAAPLSFDQQDPFQKMNRRTHDFNMAFDATFVKPIAQLYQAIIPAQIRAGVNNVFTNIHMLTVIMNDLLQADFPYAAKDCWRFIGNSTFGVLGIFDVATTRFHMPPHSNDLGLTFAKWGNKTSPYFVIPFLGPSTIRDGFSDVFDYTFFTPYPFISVAYLYPALGTRYVDLRSQWLDQEDLVKKALDRYTFIRDAYLQHRQYIIDGKLPNEGAAYIDEDREED